MELTPIRLCFFSSDKFQLSKTSSPLLGHSFDKNKGWYETTVQDVGYKNGHSVIFKEEIHSKLNKKNSEGLWDYHVFEIAAAETGTDTNYRNRLKHCAKKPGVKVAVIFIPNDTFNEANFYKGLKMYNGLKGSSQYVKFKEIIILNKHGIIKNIKPE